MSQVNFDKITIIRRMLSLGRFSDLYEMVARISKFNISLNSSRAMSEAEQTAWQYACMHLEFMAKFGPDKTSVKDGKFFRFSYPAEFEAWLQDGAPGVSADELNAYLAAQPIQ